MHSTHCRQVKVKVKLRSLSENQLLLLQGRARWTYYLDMDKVLGWGGVAVGVAAGVLAVPAVTAALGFGAGGIIAGSLAAKIMSFSAILNGGSVPAGGVVAILQSIGAVGTGLAGKILGAIGGGWLANVIPPWQ